MLPTGHMGIPQKGGKGKKGLTEINYSLVEHKNIVQLGEFVFPALNL